jgi:hypothetical protein
MTGRMIARLFDIFFGCWHRSYSFPITRRCGCRAGGDCVETYVVCLMRRCIQLLTGGPCARHAPGSTVRCCNQIK